MSFTDPDVSRPLPRARLDRALLGLRRLVLRRRRLLAALLATVAVGAGLSVASTPPQETVPVVVAARDLPAGATLSPDDVVSVGFRPGTPPADALGDEDALVGRLLAAPVTSGEPITAVRLVGADLAAAHPELRVVPLRMPDPGLVALLEVGDLIDLVAADPEDGQVTTLAIAVPVLALPASDSSTTAAGLPGSLVVVGLRPAEVAPVASAALRAFVTYTWSGR